MRTVLVTGATGFIGGQTVATFAAAGWRVFAVVHRRRSRRLEALAGQGRVRLVSGELTDAASVRAILATCREETGTAPVVAHVAGRATDVGWDRAFRRANLDTVAILAEATRRDEVERLVFVSTTDVYGILDHRGDDEDNTPLRAVPDHPYPRYKIEAERCLRSQLPAWRWTIIRPAAVWGPDDTTLTARVVAFLRRSPAIVHVGPWRGRNRWPLAHVRNVAMAIRLGAERPEAQGLAINVLDAEWTSTDAFYRLVAQTYFPQRHYATLCLPRGLAWPFAAGVSGLSTLLNLAHPLADPSLYALAVVSHNLDFANRRWLDLMRRAGLTPVSREEGLRELRQSHPGTAP